MKFETGKTYSTRSVCDSECIITVTIEKRTDKTVTCKVRGEQKNFRIKLNHMGAESIMPWGKYSMAPTISAQ